MISKRPEGNFGAFRDRGQDVYTWLNCNGSFLGLDQVYVRRSRNGSSDDFQPVKNQVQQKSTHMSYTTLTRRGHYRMRSVTARTRRCYLSRLQHGLSHRRAALRGVRRTKPTRCSTPRHTGLAMLRRCPMQPCLAPQPVDSNPSVRISPRTHRLRAGAHKAAQAVDRAAAAAAALGAT